MAGVGCGIWGWRRSGAMGRRLLGVAVLGVLIAVAGVGCSAKQKQTEAGAPGGGVGEEGLPAGSSLDRYLKGLEPGEGGPLKDVHFAFDSYELDEQARGALRENGNWLKD